MDALIRWLLLAALALPIAGLAQSENRASEVQIKAAFLYKFGDFIEWPPAAFARADAPFAIGVMGAEDVAAALEQVVAEHTVQGHRVVVRRLRRGEALSGLHVLFVGQGESARLAETLATARGQALLTVTESDNAIAHGSTRSDVIRSPASRNRSTPCRGNRHGRRRRCVDLPVAHRVPLADHAT